MENLRETSGLINRMFLGQKVHDKNNKGFWQEWDDTCSITLKLLLNRRIACLENQILMIPFVQELSGWREMSFLFVE